MDRFIFNYNGNKYQETKKHLSDWLVKNINEYDIIAEPFCGIFGFSRYAYEKGFKGEFLLNDITTGLIDAFNKLKFNMDDYITELESEIKKYPDSRSITDDKNKSYDVALVCRGLCNHLSDKDNGLKKVKNFNAKKDRYRDLFNKCQFSNLDYDEFIRNLPNNKRVLIFLDPPYFNSDNTRYSNNFKEEDGYNDGTSVYIKLYEHMKKSPHCVLFVMNKIDLINYIYKDFIKFEYKGTYQNTAMSKGKSKKHHIVYSNFTM